MIGIDAGTPITTKKIYIKNVPSSSEAFKFSKNLLNSATVTSVNVVNNKIGHL